MFTVTIQQIGKNHSVGRSFTKRRRNSSGKSVGSAVFHMEEEEADSGKTLSAACAVLK